MHTLYRITRISFWEELLFQNVGKIWGKNDTKVRSSVLRHRVRRLCRVPTPWHGHLAYYTRAYTHPCLYLRTKHVSTTSISIYCIARRLQSSRHSFIGLRAHAEKREISIRRRCRDKMNFVAWREVNARKEEEKKRERERGVYARDESKRGRKGWTISIGFFRWTCRVEWKGRKRRNWSMRSFLFGFIALSSPSRRRKNDAFLSTNRLVETRLSALLHSMPRYTRSTRYVVLTDYES